MQEIEQNIHVEEAESESRTPEALCQHYCLGALDVLLLSFLERLAKQEKDQDEVGHGTWGRGKERGGMDLLFVDGVSAG